MAQVLIGVRDLTALGFSKGHDIAEIRFETTDEVDDLVLITMSGRILIQAKRTLPMTLGFQPLSAQ